MKRSSMLKVLGAFRGLRASDGLGAGVAAVVTLATLSSLGACGPKRPAFDGGVYRDGAIAFRVPPPPPSWRRLDVVDATLAFRDDAHEASILLNARCGPVHADAPLPALVNHLLVGTTERNSLLEETLPFDGREALHARLTAKLDGVAMEYDVYVLKKDGCVYDFVWVGAPASPRAASASASSTQARGGAGESAVADVAEPAVGTPVGAPGPSNASGSPDAASAPPPTEAQAAFEAFVRGFQTLSGGVSGGVSGGETGRGS